MSLIVKGKIFTKSGLLDGSVLIEDGRITKISKEISKKADTVLDYGRKGNVILPGLVDMHVHLRDFELGYKEDFFTGTAAAAKGGFGVVGDMPNTIPRVNTMKILKERDRVAKGKALVDYALYFGVPEREGELTEGFERLAVGFKIYMQEEFYSDKRDAVERVLEHASHKKALVVVHAEDPKFFRETSAGMVGTPKAEVSAIEDISRYNPNREFPLHITHLSSSAGLKEILKLKRVTSITSDTCPHYLLLTDDDVRTKGAFAKVDPHPKRTSDLTALLSGLRRGEIEALSSDHAPHTLEEKKDLEEAKSGFPGLETTLPLLLTMVDKKMFSLQDLVRVCAANPSKILGLSAIGEIERGKLGNLTIVDLQRRTKIDPKNFMSKAKYSPFEGREVKGVPVATIVRGQPVLLDGEVVARRGWGVNVKTYG